MGNAPAATQFVLAKRRLVDVPPGRQRYRNGQLYLSAHTATNFSDVATVTITINPVPDPPVVNVDGRIDSYQVVSGTTLAVKAPGVLINDKDPDGDPLTASLVSGTAHGTLSLSSDGSFTYKPNAGYVGTDGFTYQARDPSGLTAQAQRQSPLCESTARCQNRHGQLAGRRQRVVSLGPT